MRMLLLSWGITLNNQEHVSGKARYTTQRKFMIP